MGRTEKMRARRTHGRGKKAGRGAGKRGGKGNAGLHKHKYITTVKFDPKHFGRYGFTRPRLPSEEPVRFTNVGQLENQIEKLLEAGFAHKGKDGLEIDLTSAGIHKLLGAGSVKTSLSIKVEAATEKAIKKIEAAGGQVILPESEFTETVSEAE
jgi:large subunit ribosomal protein L15